MTDIKFLSIGEPVLFEVQPGDKQFFMRFGALDWRYHGGVKVSGELARALEEKYQDHVESVIR